MNITLSANKELITKARKYAQKRKTTLNNMVREYLKKVVENSELNSADEFEKNALTFGGMSHQNYTFNRDDIYNRK